MYFNVIGAGRLGKTIAHALVHSEQAQLKAVCNNDFHHAELAVSEIGAGVAVPKLANLPAADLTFITTPDDVISRLAMHLAKEKLITPGSIVAHCSGVLTSTELNPLRELGCQIASLHPLKAFRGDKLDKYAFQACHCVIEGDNAALKVIFSLWEKLGAKMVSVKPEGKIAYHAAAVIASNYLVTLAGTAIELLDKAGIPPNLAKQMTTSLMLSSVDNIQQTTTIAAALTGPLQRGDIQTISKHLKTLPEDSPTNELYRSMGLATLSLTNLNQELLTALSSLLGTQQ